MCVGLAVGHTKVKFHRGSFRFQGVVSSLVQLLFRKLAQLQHKEIHGGGEAEVLIVEPVNYEASATSAIVWVEHCRVSQHWWDI